jgi:putative inorganic carbon (hco3(-)) transporter
MQWGDEIGAILAAAVIALSPFVPTDLTGLLLSGVAAFWVLLTLADERRGGITPIHITIGFFWAVAAISTGLSPVRNDAIGGLGKLSLYLLLFLMLARLCRSKRILNWLLAIYLNIALCVSVYGVNQSIYGARQLATWVDAESSLAKTTRVYSYLNNPNLLGGYLLPAIAFSIAACFIWRGWLHKTLAIVMVVVNTYCLQATYARGAWIGAGVMVLVAVGLAYYWSRPSLPKFWKSWALPIAIVSVVTIGGIVIFLVPSLHDRVLSIFSDRKDSSNNFRINVWEAVRKMIHDRPIFGFGPGDRVFKKIYPIYQVNYRFSALSSYSVFLDTIVQIGFVGLTCFLWSIVVTVNYGVRGVARLRQAVDSQAFWLMAAIVSIVGLLCQGAVDTVWDRPALQTIWWLCVGIIASFDRGAATTDDPQNYELSKATD